MDKNEIQETIIKMFEDNGFANENEQNSELNLNIFEKENFFKKILRKFDLGNHVFEEKPVNTLEEIADRVTDLKTDPIFQFFSI